MVLEEEEALYATDQDIFLDNVTYYLETSP